jgi:hypothetical protein
MVAPERFELPTHGLGNIIEDAVEQFVIDNGIQYIRTGSHNQEEIERRFGIPVKPAPDFVIFDETAAAGFAGVQRRE